MSATISLTTQRAIRWPEASSAIARRVNVFMGPRSQKVTPFIPVIVRGMDVAASLFGASEKLITRKGTVPASALMPGDELMTLAGYRRLVSIHRHRAGLTSYALPHLTDVMPSVEITAGRFRGDLRKLLFVRGAGVELISGTTSALLRLSDLFGRVTMRPNSSAPSTSYELRFERPEILITEQGCFASQIDASLPLCLSTDEVMVILASSSGGRGALQYRDEEDDL